MFSTHLDTHPQEDLLVPNVPVLVARHNHAFFVTGDGEMFDVPANQLGSYLSLTPLVCHLPSTASRLSVAPFMAFDILELFAFVHPAEFVIPSPTGLAQYFNMAIPASHEDEAFVLIEAMNHLLSDLKQGLSPQSDKAKKIILGMKDWIWMPFIAHALGVDLNIPEQSHGFKVWRDLPEWSDHAPEPAPGHHALSEQEALDNLHGLLTHMNAEKRDEQEIYTAQSVHAFTPRKTENQPNIVMAEAGTGTGKTLGYLAASQKWAQKNTGQVWISTYTKNLQRQIGHELDKAYPDPVEKRLKTVIRKGRENYLCLLNYEDLVRRASMPGQKKMKVTAGLMARWIGATQNGDIRGGDFPGWLVEILGYGLTAALTDQRGECIHAACPHYNKCFIEKNIRKSKSAEIVVANHALVMIQNALSGEFMDDIQNLPSRYVFDEAHHVFDAADSAFSSHLSGRETLELRRWILGNEHGRGLRAGRTRGLKTRMDDLVPMDDRLTDMLQTILISCRALASNGWVDRLNDKNPAGPMECFLSSLYEFVTAKAEGQDKHYALEAPKLDVPDSILSTARDLHTALIPMIQAAEKICAFCEETLNAKQDELETSDKQKIEGLIKSLQKRLIIPGLSWLDMLKHIGHETPANFLDWFVIERIEGHIRDVGFYRHYINPMVPFAKSLEKQSHGLMFTSATLTEGADDPDMNRINAQDFVGIPHFEKDINPQWVEVASPFDYKNQAKIIIINDVDTRNPARVASAYEALFKASGGGALGLFTSIQKLKDIHAQLSPKMESAHLPLYAQHIDQMDVATLVDIFKAEENSCLLGTDAIRDGVDVPGASLRLLVFDKVPWPRPDLLHKARREYFGSRRYDERLTRLKLKQAFGRLIRTKDDKGVFVMLESRLPSRLCTAFPPEIEIEKVGLKDAVQMISDFF